MLLVVLEISGGLLTVVNLADRRKVLRHHPDKKASGGGDANDDSFFKCIAKGQPYFPVSLTPFPN